MLVAEVCRHFLPKLVDLNNYVPAHSVAQKEANWQTLATKVLRKLGMKLTKGEIEAVASSKPMHIEPVLQTLQAFRTRYAGDPEAAKELLSVGDVTLPEGIDVSELAAWAMIANAVLSSDSAIVKD